MSTNHPKFVTELAPWEGSFIMDSLYAHWQVYVTACATNPCLAYDRHVLEWRKHTCSRLLNHIDDSAERQGFWEDGKGL